MSKRFAALNIRAELIAVLQEMGVTDPTPIQQQAIPPLLAGQDMIGQAQTGTGKTLAFVLPILEKLDITKNAVQALIITPTRELAIQIAEEVKKLAPAVGANVLAAYGGQDVERQIRKLAGGIHIVIGTPGRLLDHLRRETVHFGKLDQLVLDEADQMLHMGFLKEVEEIIAQTPSRRQTMLFSATMPAPIRALAKQYMRDPLEIRIEPKRVTLDEIQQVAIHTTDRGKQDALVLALREYNPYLAMIFCRTKRRAGGLNKALQEMGFSADELHGDLSQAKREQVMKRFREAKIQFLVATDMAARGIDVEGITHVFNYDIPHDVDSYIHRIGRTGRAGKNGIAVTLVSPHDRAYLDMIERGINQRIIAKDGRQPSGGPSVSIPGGAQTRGGRGRSEDRGEQRGARGTGEHGGSGGARGIGERGGRRGTGAAGEFGSVRRSTGGVKRSPGLGTNERKDWSPGERRLRRSGNEASGVKSEATGEASGARRGASAAGGQRRGISEAGNGYARRDSERGGGVEVSGARRGASAAGGQRRGISEAGNGYARRDSERGGGVEASGARRGASAAGGQRKGISEAGSGYARRDSERGTDTGRKVGTKRATAEDLSLQIAERRGRTMEADGIGQGTKAATTGRSIKHAGSTKGNSNPRKSGSGDSRWTYGKGQEARTSTSQNNRGSNDSRKRPDRNEASPRSARPANRSSGKSSAPRTRTRGK